MTTVTKRATDESADQVVATLAGALKRAGLATDIMEPSTVLRVFSPTGNASMDEVITLRPDANEVLTWYWSWGAPIGPASEAANTVIKLKRVTAATVS